MSASKWFTRSTVLLIALAAVLAGFGFATGKIASLSIRIHHAVPDVDIQLQAPHTSLPAPTTLQTYPRRARSADSPPHYLLSVRQALDLNPRLRRPVL